MWSYTAGEVADPTIDDEWKCLIYLAYSAHDPVTAANYSSSLTGWGTGNTYSNQLYFLSTRPVNTGSVCTNANSNPVGNFVLQDTASGKYVVSTSGSPNLVASGASQSSGATFNFAFAPNAGTIKSTSTSMFVTADQTGTDALSAARTVASTWEIFVVRPKSGAASGVYTIQAGSNKLWVSVGSDGSLINGATSASAASGFKLVSV